ncbi:N-acetyltransferase [Aquimarina sp. I32.4]|uniref:GNAT family N-acetyltransferase n=1 Tax=Aquimarina sp. I32.4 TaxID=2053903 RepID=UPI000CDE5A07|nr:GNAT family N-acetyltransferase [Aquimarina sp. I32.4]
MADNFVIEHCNKENCKKIVSGINKYNLSKVPPMSDTWTPLEYVVKGKNNEEIAGILAGIGYWNGLEIKILWVKEEYRNNKIGTRLLTHVEKMAIDKGATIAMLDTFDFQAKDFYIKNGYSIIGEIPNFPKKHKRFYFSKRLTHSND